MPAAIEKLIRAAEEAGLDCDGRDLADVVWLAAWMQRSGPPAPLTAPPVRDSNDQTKDSTNRETGGGAKTDPLGLQPKTSAPEDAAVHLPAPIPTQGGRRSARPFHAPVAGALPAKLALARSLRPLLRRVPSRTAWLLHEDETAQRIAATGVWMPEMRPAPERAFHLTLVVDDSVSMSVWARTAQELRTLFGWTGAFRDLCVFRMNADGATPTFADALGRSAERPLRHRVRAYPDGRHLLFVFSDCVARAWRNGGVREHLLAWARAASVCLIEVLPEPMWAGTALGRARKVRLRKPSLRPSNRSLVAAPLDPWFDPPVPDGLRLPVATLEPAGLGSLSRLLAGFSGGWSPGVVLAAEQELVAAQGVPVELTADERVENFRRLASPTAARLAGLVAVTPVVSLQVIRLIRCALVPEARQVHEAEFLLGGLLYAVRHPEEALAGRDDLYFRFYEGVTERLLDAVPTPAWVDVLRHVSAHVERHLGELDGFRAFLEDPEATAESSEVSSSPFVRLAASRLVRLGGGYARWAQKQAETGGKVGRQGVRSGASDASETLSSPECDGRPPQSVPTSASCELAEAAPPVPSASMLVYPVSVPEAPPPPRHPSWAELLASLKSLWFPVVGVPASGKTLWLVMAYDLLTFGTPPSAGHFTTVPVEAAHDLFDHLSRNLREPTSLRQPPLRAVPRSPSSFANRIAGGGVGPRSW